MPDIMAVSTENLRRWIEQSNIDYVTYFIKAWIPFNAWYNGHFANLEGERSKINATKNNSNPVRNAISNYLENSGQEGESFRNYLSGLHNGLQNQYLNSQEGRISFHEIIKERNAKNQVDNEEIRKIKYFLKRFDGAKLGDVSNLQIFLKDSSGATFFNYKHEAYDFEHVKNINSNVANFQKLTPWQQENVRIFFNELQPVITIDAIQNLIDESPKNYYKCDSYYFKRDANNAYCKGNYICKSLIEILYQLRNILFHGELIPSDGIQPVYSNGYFLLKLILDKIK